MDYVYVVQHELDDVSADVKLIGVYSSMESAEEAVDRLRRKPGFITSPDGFIIDRYKLDRDHWADGFVSI
ncbi:DUF7336 domain-containing protein [Nocardia macrotermitis]